MQLNMIRLSFSHQCPLPVACSTWKIPMVVQCMYDNDKMNATWGPRRVTQHPPKKKILLIIIFFFGFSLPFLLINLVSASQIPLLRCNYRPSPFVPCRPPPRPPHYIHPHAPPCTKYLPTPSKRPFLLPGLEVSGLVTLGGFPRIALKVALAMKRATGGLLTIGGCDWEGKDTPHSTCDECTRTYSM